MTEREPDHRHQRLDDQADHDRPAGQRVEQRALHSLTPIGDGGNGALTHGRASSAVHGVDFAILKHVSLLDREAQTQRAIQHHLSARRTGTRSLDRRDHHADLPDLDLRPGGARPAQGLRVRADPESDAHGARAQHRGHRGRQGRVRVRLGHGGDRRHRHAAQGRRSRRRLGQHLRRNVPAVRQGAVAATSWRFSYVDTSKLDDVERAMHAERPACCSSRRRPIR